MSVPHRHLNCTVSHDWAMVLMPPPRSTSSNPVCRSKREGPWQKSLEVGLKELEIPSTVVHEVHVDLPAWWATAGAVLLPSRVGWRQAKACRHSKSCLLVGGRVVEHLRRP